MFSRTSTILVRFLQVFITGFQITTKRKVIFATPKIKLANAKCFIRASLRQLQLKALVTLNNRISLIFFKRNCQCRVNTCAVYAARYSYYRQVKQSQYSIYINFQLELRDILIHKQATNLILVHFLIEDTTFCDILVNLRNFCLSIHSTNLIVNEHVEKHNYTSCLKGPSKLDFAHKINLNLTSYLAE